MIYWNPPLYKHNEDLNDTLCILGTDKYCNFGAVIAQPVVKLGKVCIALGQAKRSWINCFTEVK